LLATVRLRLGLPASLRQKRGRGPREAPAADGHAIPCGMSKVSIPAALNEGKPLAQYTMKLAIREDKKVGLIRAFWASMDETVMDEVATLSAALARATPGLFERWHQALQWGFEQWLASKGIKAMGWEEFRPKDKN